MACGRSDWIVARGNADAPSHSDSDTQQTAQPWGSYAATLDVPACPNVSNSTLVVNTTAEDLDGGPTLSDPALAGATLSFLEAMQIAKNRAGGNTIYFDPAVFPVDRAATIWLSGEPPLASGQTDTCIDARNRGVILNWGKANISNTFSLGSGSLMVGLTLLYPGSGNYLMGGQVAGCRLATDGYSTFVGPIVDVLHLANSTFGPGNVVSGSGHWGLTVAGNNGIVRENSFGYDPLTGIGLNNVEAFDAWPNTVGARFEFEDNVFAGSNTLIYNTYNVRGVVELRRNRFGTTWAGEPLPQLASGATPGGLRLEGNLDVTVGPGNSIRNVATAIAVADSDDLRVRITQNEITQNAQGIVAVGMSGIATLGLPPGMTWVNSAIAEGVCYAAGSIELFSDTGLQGESYLGTTPCDVGAPWHLETTMPRGRNVTAIFTDTSGRSSSFSIALTVP